jgi:2-polyprenyl-3-methyl-5-hydroxy-6-metoxy-1,4-benzoquinol methylase
MSTQAPPSDGYLHSEPVLHIANRLVLPVIAQILDGHPGVQAGRRIFEVGCGTGASAHWLQGRGYDVTAVDPSPSGVALAHEHFPHLKLHPGSGYDNLARKFGQFPCVLSMEVIEHLYNPRLFVARVFDLVAPGGIVILTTPFHGYWKNLTLALTGRMDAHFTALWDHGHIKFWSASTLRQLLGEAGFADIRIHRVGRIPPWRGR